MSTFLNNFFQADTAAMDPVFFSSTNGIPSESKLATYMSRQNVTTPTYGLSTGFSKLTLGSPVSVKKTTQVTPQSPEFIPSRLNSSPNFYSPYVSSILNNTTVGGNGNGSGGGGGNGILNQSSVVKTTSNISTPILGNQNVSGQVSSATISSVVNAQNVPVTQNVVSSSSYSVTPLKSRNPLIRNDSPQSAGDMSPKQITPQTSPTPTTLAAGVLQQNVGGTIYFYPTANHNSSQSSSVVSDSIAPQSTSNSSQLYSHPGHSYPGPSSSVIGMQPNTLLSSAFFMPEELRSDIQTRNEIANLMLDSTENSNLPIEIDNYHSLYPLETQPSNPKLPLPSSTYKATHGTTGVKYCLRRLHGFRCTAKCMTVVEIWKKLQHSNVVQLRNVFTTKSFGDHSLVLVYDYHPGSQTLLSKYFTPPSDANGYTDPFPGEARPFSHKSALQRSNGPLLPEATIWSIIMQLTSGLRAIHQAGLACRTLDPTKIIVTGRRIRFSFLGVTDIVSFDPNHSNGTAGLSNVYQQEDLTSLGKLVLALACRCLHSVHRDNVQSSIELVSRQYSPDLRNLIIYLLTTTTRRSVTDLMPMIGARFYTQLDALQSQCDMQEDELAKEMENGRLYRLLVKLGCVNERPDFNMDVTWSETGDRYMLKLFRDYLFHSVTDDGRPWLDHAHIVQCLNKLDAGTMEKVQLMSRDEQSVLVVTYAELKNCLENAFSELVANANS